MYIPLLVFVHKIKFILIEIHKTYGSNMHCLWAGALPQTLLEELTALPKPIRWFRRGRGEKGKGPLDRQRKVSRERREGRPVTYLYIGSGRKLNLV